MEFPNAYRMNMIIITTTLKTIICPGLNLILLAYSSKYLTSPPIPDGMEILSLAILLKLAGFE